MEGSQSGRFGRYEILGELGRGAMGVVYKARDPKINRVVAVKTISLAGQLAEEEHEYRQRFFREAEAAGRLSHPGIVTIFDVGEEPETRVPYIVMEYVGGESLDRLLAKDDRGLPVETALQLAYELAEALDCAHAQGVVHRDLKPANILLTEDGRAKIADFGVAKLNLAHTTLAGRALGTPAYMSPEQLNGEAVDGRSDLFSLGVVLYTMLTGHRPFQGNSAITVSFKVVNHDFIPATILNTELPDGLDHIIARAMAKDPAERYQRGGEMLLDIKNLREAQDRLSKEKASSSTLSRSLAQTGQGKTRSSVFEPPGASTKPGVRPRLSVPRDAAANHLLKSVPKKSYVGVLVLAGLVTLALWVISVRNPGARPRAAGPLPQATEIANDKKPATTAATEAASVGTTSTGGGADASVAPSRTTKGPPAAKAGRVPTASMERTAKPVPAGRIYPALARGVRTSSTSAFPAASPGISQTVIPVISPAMLEIEVDHQFATANLSIWVDDQLAYVHRLEGLDKKRLIVFHHVQGHEIHAMQLAPGKHHLRVEVTSDRGAATKDNGSPTELSSGSRSFDQSNTVEGDFASGQEHVLHIIFKHGEMNLSLQ